MSWNVLQNWAGGNASSAVTKHTHTHKNNNNNNTTLFQWTCNTMGNGGENTLRIHGRLELSHLDEFNLVAVITAMNQKNRPIKSPWVPLLCLQSISFSVSEAALVDYNIAAVHAKIPDKGASKNLSALVIWQRVIHKSRLEHQILWQSTHACSFLCLKWQEGILPPPRRLCGICCLWVCEQNLKKLWMDFKVIFRKSKYWAKEQLIKFWWGSRFPGNSDLYHPKITAKGALIMKQPTTL